MFKTAKPQPKSQETRSQILHTALGIFRQRGLDAATMREIAKAADVALGAAYYYFPSKEAIVQAYYDEVQTEHARRVSEALSSNAPNLLERLRIAFHSKLDILRNDRRLLGALFRYTGEPDHPLSVLGAATRTNRDQAIAVFRLAIGDESLPEDIAAILPLLLWSLHLGALLYFIYDNSPEQQRTRKLVDGTLALLVRFLGLVKLPLLRPFRGNILALLRDAGLLPSADGVEPLGDSLGTAEF